MNGVRTEAGVEVKAEAFAEVESARDVEPETVMGPCLYQGAWLSRVTPWSQKRKEWTCLKTQGLCSAHQSDSRFPLAPKRPFAVDGTPEVPH
ncbi:hypothetical protein P7K49_039324, partial [Saguinus oedipus]